MSTVKWHDVTHSCTVDGAMHIQVVCNPPLTKKKKKLGAWLLCIRHFAHIWLVRFQFELSNSDHNLPWSWWLAVECKLLWQGTQLKAEPLSWYPTKGLPSGVRPNNRGVPFCVIRERVSAKDHGGHLSVHSFEVASFEHFGLERPFKMAAMIVSLRSALRRAIYPVWNAPCIFTNPLKCHKNAVNSKVKRS